MRCATVLWVGGWVFGAGLLQAQTPLLITHGEGKGAKLGMLFFLPDLGVQHQTDASKKQAQKPASRRSIPGATVEVIGVADRAQEYYREVVVPRLFMELKQAFDVGLGSGVGQSILSQFMRTMATNPSGWVAPDPAAVWYNATAPSELLWEGVQRGGGTMRVGVTAGSRYDTRRR